MSALPLRPALADVLRALTSDLHGTMESALAGDQISLGPKPYFECRTDEVALLAKLGPADRRSTGCKTGIYSSRPWITRDPIEAFETLISRGVLPDEWAGDVRRAFWCVHCRGTGVFSDEWAGGGGQWECDYCPRLNRDRGTGWMSLPFDIPMLVSWASLGPAAILRAEELARETVRRLRPWDAPQPERVVWRVGGRDEHKLVWSSDGGGHEVCSCGRGDPVSSPAAEIYVAGLAIDSITADAITIVVPPIGGEA